MNDAVMPDIYSTSTCNLSVLWGKCVFFSTSAQCTPANTNYLFPFPDFFGSSKKSPGIDFMAWLGKQDINSWQKKDIDFAYLSRIWDPITFATRKGKAIKIVHFLSDHQSLQLKQPAVVVKEKRQEHRMCDDDDDYVYKKPFCCTWCERLW